MRFGVYVHFPHCLHQCPYCDFAVTTAQPQGERYAGATLRELALRAPDFDGLECASIYFGGGTPSLWEPAQVGRVADAVARRFAVAKDAEVTLEANPENTGRGRLRGYRAAGVNRLSLGVQSFDLGVLRKLGRRHTPEQAERAVRDAASVFDDVSLDLIYGARRSTVELARADARKAASLPVTHVSAYALTLDVLAVDVPLARLRREGRLPLPSEAQTVAQGRALRGALARGGFKRYELSNYARGGKESRHNRLYWAGESYLGLGAGAYGCRVTGGEAVRYGNLRDLAAWYARVEQGELPTGEVDRVDAAARRRERVMLALRTAEGVAEEELPEARRGEVEALVRNRLALRRKGRLVLTARGLDLHSAVAERFF